MMIFILISINGSSSELSIEHICSIKELLKIPNRTYYHTWDTFDIAIYDNWSFVHNRSKLILNSDEIRNFYRANIDLVI